MKPLTFTGIWDAPPLRSNKRLHHMAEHRIKRDIRQAGYVQAKRWIRDHPDAQVPIQRQVEVVMIWTVPTRHRRDASSGAPTIKSWVDGAVEAGLLRDDSFEFVKREVCEIEHRPNWPMGVRIEIRPVGDA